MAGYLGSLRVMRPHEDEILTQLQGQISTMTKNIQELTLPKEIRPLVWCTTCYTKGHSVTKCLRLMGEGPSSTPLEPLSVGPSGGVVKFSTTTPFHGPIQYHAFLNNQGGPYQ
jgi:hypothetical protein